MKRTLSALLVLTLVLAACERRSDPPRARVEKEGAAVRAPSSPALSDPALRPGQQAARKVLPFAQAQRSMTSYRKALSEGRDLLDRGQLSAAREAFRAALAAAPDDPVALSELGYVAYRQGKLTEAEDATRLSLATALPTDHGVRAASLYNLGQIQKRRGELSAAAVSFTQSLHERDHKAVRAALARLPVKAPVEDEKKPAPQAGPLIDWRQMKDPRVIGHVKNF